MPDIDMRTFAKGAGVNLTFPAGSTIFTQGDKGDCLYVVQEGIVEMVIHDKVIEVCGANEAIGFMSLIDGAPPQLDGSRQRNRASLGYRSTQFPLYGRRSPELCKIHHGSDGKPYPRHGKGHLRANLPFESKRTKTQAKAQQ